MSNEDQTQLEYNNIPFGSSDSVVREVAFGALSEDFVMLIEFNPVEGPIRVSVGNGPENEDGPAVLAEILRDIAAALDDVHEGDEYWAALQNHIDN